jgi:hypothetical protein
LIVSGVGERDQCNDHHDDAGHPRPAQKAVEGHDGRDHENRECEEPMAGDAADRQPQHDIGDMGTADHDPVNETVVHRDVRGEIIALRGGVFDLAVVGHSLLQVLRPVRQAGISAITLRGQRRNLTASCSHGRQACMGVYGASSTSHPGGSTLGRGLVETDGREHGALPLGHAAD